jgi:hypothetical protein
MELQAAAERCAQRLGEPAFEASTGWPFIFYNRHGVANRKNLWRKSVELM